LFVIVTFTLATGGIATSSEALALLPSLVAAIAAVPNATAVTVMRDPLPLTVATLASLDVQVTTRSVSAWPRESRTMAVASVV
jgi:hypothetical protein